MRRLIPPDASRRLLIAVVVAAFSTCCIGATKEPKSWYFPVVFRPGATLSLKVSTRPNSNIGRPQQITFQPWLPDGSLREKITANISPGVPTEIRVDMNLDRIEIGWIQFIATESFTIQGTLEILNGNSWTTVPLTLQTAIQPTENIRYHADLSGTQTQVAILMNVSDRPIQIGLCETDYSGCVPPSQSTIMPHLTAVLPISPQKRHLILECHGSSVAAVADLVQQGFIKTFEASSSIKYVSVK